MAHDASAANTETGWIDVYEPCFCNTCKTQIMECHALAVHDASGGRTLKCHMCVLLAEFLAQRKAADMPADLRYEIIHHLLQIKNKVDVYFSAGLPPPQFTTPTKEDQAHIEADILEWYRR